MSKKADTGLSEPLVAPQKFTVIRLEILPFPSFLFLLFILPACIQKYMGCLSSLSSFLSLLSNVTCLQELLSKTYAHFLVVWVWYAL